MADSSNLPPCGLYRTVKPIGEVPAGRLAYFHNHGDPGPGLYFPDSWTDNRAHFAERGSTLSAGFDTSALKPLPREGFYRVVAEFYCCAKNCMKFEVDSFVQLGYNGAGQALLFTPELSTGAIAIPQRGNIVDDDSLKHLVELKVREGAKGKPGAIAPFPRGIVIH